MTLGARLTKELVAALAVAAIAALVIAGSVGGRAPLRPLPQAPPLEAPAEVALSLVPAARPRLLTRDRSADASGGGRDPFALADEWEDPEPATLPPPPEPPALRAIPVLSIAGGRVLAPRPPTLTALPTPVTEDPPATTGGATEGAAAPPPPSVAPTLPARPAPPPAPTGADNPSADFISLDRLYMRGLVDPMEGTIVEETKDAYRFIQKGRTTPIIIAKSDVDHVIAADRPERVAADRARKLAADDAGGHLDLARFCARYGLERQAEEQAGIAARASGPDEAGRARTVEAYRLISKVLRERYAKVAPEVWRDVRERELGCYERAQAQHALAPDLWLAKARLLRDSGAVEAALGELLALAREVAPVPETATAGDGAEPQQDADPELGRGVRLLLGDVALSLGRQGRAEAAYGAAVARDPQDAAALEGTGLAAFARGDMAAAGERLDRAVAAAPGRGDLLVERGIAALHAGDLAAADAAFARAHEAGAGSAELALYEGVAAALRGRTKRASDLLARAAADAEGAPTSPTSSAIAMQARLAQGLVLEISGKSSEAVDVYGQAEAAAMQAGAPRFAGLSGLLRAQALTARGAAPLAEEALRKATREGLDFPAAAAAIARARREARDFATAVRFSRYAQARRPDDHAVLAGLGRSYLGAGALDDAEAAFDAALALAPESIEAIDGKAAVTYARRDFAGAETLFRHALELEPDDAFAALAMRRLGEARARRVWRDTFARPDTKDVRNRWTEDERFGVEAMVRGGRLVFSGRGAAEDMGRTQVARTVDGERLAELRVRIEPAGAGDARVGLRLTSRDGEVAFFRAGDGSLAYVSKAAGRGEWTDPKPAGSWPRAAGPHELWFAIGGPDRGEVLFGVDQDETARVKLPAFGKATSFSCAIYVQAPLGAPVEVVVQEAKVFVTRETRAGKGGGY